jgi:hypothetical protein
MESLEYHGYLISVIAYVGAASVAGIVAFNTWTTNQIFRLKEKVALNSQSDIQKVDSDKENNAKIWEFLKEMGENQKTMSKNINKVFMILAREFPKSNHDLEQ